MNESLSGFGRFVEPALLILVALAGGPKHGYAMMDEIGRVAGARIGPGTLYAALARLEARGLIESLPAEQRRRPYRLTETGAAVLRGQLEGMERFARVGLARLAPA